MAILSNEAPVETAWTGDDERIADEACGVAGQGMAREVIASITIEIPAGTLRHLGPSVSATLRPPDEED